MKKEELNQIFAGVISLLRNAPKTIVMDNRGTTRGQVYEIRTASHKQAETGIGDRLLFIGSRSETAKYLQGYRDCIIECQQQ